MEREYTVIVNNRDDLAALETELTASTGDGPIPARSVDIANPRPGSRVQTHFMLTDEEAEALRSDPRVRAVEIPPEQRDDVRIVRRSTQAAQFRRSATFNTNWVNWGLRRCIDATNLFNNTDTVTDVYEYALDGEGVDIVIQDSGIQADHPEWQDASGVSRLQQINWYTASGLSGTQDANFYTDYDGHGTHCAGIAAGKTYGWAKGARIYAQKLAGLEGPTDPGNGIPVASAFDAIRLWHLSKGGSRPTVVNMSWGFMSTVSGDPSSGTYRGSSWSFPGTYSTDLQLWSNVGIVAPYQNGDRDLPARLASIDAEVEDMIADGIHIVIAAGNDYYKGDVVGGPDYNNSVVFGGFTYFYHRGSSPTSENAHVVGNIDSAQLLDSTVYVDKTAESSSRGPRVNIWAPGNNIISTMSNTNEYTSTGAYPADTDFKVARLSGTSMAAPQVAGVIAQHLQIYPDATPARIVSRLENDAQNVLYTTGQDDDYEQFTTSIMGSTNRILYTRYGRQPGQITNSTEVLAAPEPTLTLVAPSAVNEGSTFRVTLNTQYVPNNVSYNWTVTGIQLNDLEVGALTGTFTIQNGTASVDFTVSADQLTEGNQTMTFALDNGLASVDILINDTSLTPPPESYNFNVTADGTTAYTLSGSDRTGNRSGDNITIQINRFDTLTFNVDASGHPFWLKTAATTGTGDAISGVTGNGTDSGTVSYTFLSLGTYYYQCEIHSSMGGQIVVS